MSIVRQREIWLLEKLGGLLFPVLPSPKDFVYALRVANIPNVKWVVDEDGSMYMKFQDRLHSDFTAIHHFFVGGRMMVKFHKVVTVRKRHHVFDSSFKPIYGRRNRNDTGPLLN
jgi:hypothetical protein